MFENGLNSLKVTLRGLIEDREISRTLFWIVAPARPSSPLGAVGGNNVGPNTMAKLPIDIEFCASFCTILRVSGW